MLFCAMIAVFGAHVSAPAQDPLELGFKSPPASARPHTWWHWMNGNVTKEGITADLEAMKRVGIGGAQMFTVPEGIPKGPVDYMSPKWREMTAWAVKEAGRLGIELCIHNCAGWSSSGGPWITPANAMQVIAWSETKVRGPGQVTQPLKQGSAPQLYGSVPYYKDIAVFAFPTPMEGDLREGGPQGQNRALFLGKTGVNRADSIQPDLSPLPAGLAVPKDKVFNITDRLDSATGKLNWDAPPGNWTILRMGHVPTGKDNHPAPPEGDGLEVDKLSREALKTHWDGMMAKVLKDVGPLAGKVLNNSLIDSYEVGSQNWTPKFREGFKRLRGYDPLPYLPAISGLVIESREVTERFLWDYRRTIADLFRDNYYQYFGELCHQNGLLFSTEPYGNGGFDNIQAGGTSDIPMGEFWIGGGAIETTKVASSTGHIYGRKFIGAESFTADEGRGRFLEEPYGIKALGDLIFCNGINRYIFHRYAMQPWMDLNPGMTMGPWGSHFERTETWWQGPNPPAAAWMKYIARCQFLLQEGRFVADAVYCTGEAAPADLPYRPNLQPSLPAGYDYDGVDAEALIERAYVADGRVTFPSGMSYKVLVMPDSLFMPPRMARKIRDLVAAGATVVCRKPDKSPSLSDMPLGDAEVSRIAAEVWGNLDGKTVTEQVYGKGKVLWGVKLEQVFAEANLPKDFEAKGRNGAARTAYIHRRMGSAEAYFVSNQRYQWAEMDATFRVSGKMPELWHPETGAIEPAPVYKEENGRTTVFLQLSPAESVFVIFRKPMPSNHIESFEILGGPGAKAAPVITIKSAHYGTDDGRGTDVTAVVTSLVAQGETEISASNGLFGDPVVNVVKRLRIEYELDGKTITKTARENESVVLVSSAGSGEAPSYLISGGPGGVLQLAKLSSQRMDFSLTSGSRTADGSSTIRALSRPVAGPWNLSFAPGLGAPPSVKLAKLSSWTESSIAGVKYFSGTAKYRSTFELARSARFPFEKTEQSAYQVLLDLGTVKNFARVRLNGKEFPVLWKEPFMIDVTGVLKPGVNRLEIEVTNLWPNRLIGDEQLPPDVEWEGMRLKKWPDWLVQGKPRPKTGRIAFTTWHFWRKDSKLLESGLIGPVVIRSVPVITVRPPK